MKLLLIGAGNMGGAMLEGLQSYDITVVEAYEKRAQELQTLYPSIKVINTIPNIDNFIVILAIKPQSLEALEVQGRAEGLISILAGVKLNRLKSKIDADYYVRAMPNMAALVKKSATSLCGDSELKEEAIKILETIGKCFWLEDENTLDIATGLAGSAPAWVALVAYDFGDQQIDFYRRAVETEDKAYELYMEKANEMSDPKHKEIFLTIAQEELRHKDLLENILEFVERPTEWLESAEFYKIGD